MLDELLSLGNDPGAEAELLRRAHDHVALVRASARRGDRSLIGKAEAAVRADPGALVFDDNGSARLTAGGHSWSAGRFVPAAIGTLRAWVTATKGRSAHRVSPEAAPRARLWVLDGASPATDIGALQALCGEGALFQVASQLNCLEAPGPYVVPVVEYLHDPTQGPRASVSAFPATLLRHYAAPGPGGRRFTQVTDGPQIELLADVCEPAVARAQNGYLVAESVHDPGAFLAALESRFDAIRVGVHDAAEVVLGYNWDGGVDGPAPRHIAQVFTSTAAGGLYGAERLGPLFEPVCRQLLRAAYLGTLLAAASLGKSRVVLTLIGGGVFGNPIEVIWGAIQWAMGQVDPILSSDLDVIVNGRNLGERLSRETILAPVRARGGVMLAFDGSGRAGVLR
jgi:hypothetical protein